MGTAGPDLNEVVLSGRLSAAPEARVLPSGRELTTFRLVVRRSKAANEFAKPGGRAQRVDVLECAVWRRPVAARLAELDPGDALIVRGALRRRFTRSGNGLTSWVNVEVTEIEAMSGPAHNPTLVATTAE